MKLVNLLPVHNEAWVLGLTLRAMRRWCDGVVVLLHSCTDGSEAIVDAVSNELGGITVLYEPRPEWQEMPMRQRMLMEAREQGATHISMFDADEVLTGNLLDSIRPTIERLTPRNVLELPGYNLRGGIDRYHATGVWGNRWFAAAFGDDPRLGWDGDQFHHRAPMGPVMLRRFVPQGAGGIMHLWGVSERRLRAKHAAYKITEALRWPSKSRREIDNLYSLAIHGTPGIYGTHATWQYSDIPEAWWEPYSDIIEHLDLASAPTQEAEIAQSIAAHGPERFAGLDLFGYEQCQSQQEHVALA